MRWTDRQRALLREMGIAPWPPGVGTPAAAAAPAPGPTPEPMPQAPTARTEAPVPRHDDAGAAAPRPRPPIAIHAPPSPAASAGPRDEPRRPAGDVAAMDWPALRAAVASCTACGLCEGRTQTVFGVGNEHANWMLVGEAPGEQEDRQGEPFVGKAGQLLDAMLRAVGLTREAGPPDRQVYIANVLKCRPPHNRNPLPQEVAQCEPFLVRQVELVQPKLILAMGRFAVQSVLQTQEPIGRLRGKVHHYHGVPVVVTYHPAYLLRNPLDKARSWDDLCLAREVLAQAAG